MATSFETTFQQWADKHRDEEPNDEECKRLQDEFVAFQEKSDGLLARFESILEIWEKKVPQSEAYQTLKRSAEQRTPSALSIVTSLSWKDLEFAAHVVRRYLHSAEGQGRNVSANARWLRSLAQLSVRIDEANFVHEANYTTFPRHKEAFENRTFTKSLRNQSSSFLLVKEISDIASKARKAKRARSKNISPDSVQISDQISAWVERGLISSPSGGTQTLRELEPTAYATWMLSFDEYGFLIADTRTDRADLLPMMPANALQSPPPSSPPPTLLSSPSVTSPEPVEVHQYSSHSSASSLTDDSLDGSTIAASEPPKQPWVPAVSDGFALPDLPHLPEPSTVELTVLDSFPDQSDQEETPEIVPSSERLSSEVHVGHRNAAAWTTGSMFCGRLAQETISQIVSDILTKWKKEASAPGASQVCRQRSECVDGSWARRVTPKWSAQNASAVSRVVQCTPGRMLHLARTTQPMSDVYLIRPGQRTDPVDSSIIYELEALGGIPGTGAASVALDVADAPEWPLAASTESRFTALPHNPSSSYVGHGLRGSFREPIAYDLCGVWIRLVLGNAILSVRSQADQEWEKIYLRSGDTAYLSSRKMHAIAFVTNCTVCEYVTLDAAGLVQELEDMQTTPRAPINLPGRIQTRSPWLGDVLADPSGLKSFIDEATTGLQVETILDRLKSEFCDQRVSAGL
ncbi:hypothetical protein M409DRAFT_61650 [Zasmidium cellare ATCC 36951]|uniref:Uncharacterized protein n=1 Tax=Zasmidium cellare ATCC 36951 TaxID=1080233 RepID=A0A6A6BUH4_ZASCE|nr:uncharacterized protein M409DRAFT_61650 [Zasmidium cellare ATCC 36951]KAF2158447.1 hypothetical protein M409DRAFT_61650 [Zasmidium cellare ATCC 36951]